MVKKDLVFLTGGGYAYTIKNFKGNLDKLREKVLVSGLIDFKFGDGSRIIIKTDEIVALVLESSKKKKKKK